MIEPKVAPTLEQSVGSVDWILETHDLCRSFGGFYAVRDVSLRVRRGTVHALIGPNGAGKTTVFNLLTKFLQPTSGTIILNGVDISRARPSDVAQKGLVRSFQISAVFPHLTVRENLEIALQRRLGTTFQLWRSKAVLRQLAPQVERLLESVGLLTHIGDVAANLPYGRKRALELATTLALDPEVLLLDEPMAGLGREDIKLVTGLIRSVAATRTVLMVEHNLSVVADLSHRITVLTRGRTLVEGTYEEVSRDPEVIAAYMGGRHDRH